MKKSLLFFVFAITNSFCPAYHAEQLLPTKTIEVSSVSKGNYTIGNYINRIVDTIPNNRQLSLTKKGKFKAVNGETVDFNFPINPKIKSYCYTPSPTITSNSRDASCPYLVSCDNPTNRDDADYYTIKYFTLKWHVMLDGGTSTNINQTKIDQLMAELNSDYATHNIIFCADPATFHEDASNYVHDIETEEASLKAAYVDNPAEIINIYVVGNMSTGGYARLPFDPMGGTTATGGIVLNRVNCSLGTHTLAHEMGHVFGLLHTFSGVDEQSSCSNCYEKVRNVNGSSNTTGVATPLGGPYTDEGDREGDWCSDTHPHDINSHVCSTSSNSNGACDSDPWNNAPINNHMSYSYCTTQFTSQQARRMHCMIDNYLQSWVTAGASVCGFQPPEAEFVGSHTFWQSPSIVDFTDLSVPSIIITSWNWKFDVGGSSTVTCVGCTGTQASFSGQNPPQVTYPNPGLYTVSLTVMSSNGPNTETKTDYITVFSNSNECDTLSDQWDTPAPSPNAYTWSSGGFVTGVPDTLTQSNPSDTKIIYERFFSPSPGTTPIGAVRVGLGELADADTSMVFKILVYDDDGSGAPGTLLGGSSDISPTELGVPGANLYDQFWIHLENPVIPTTSNFHVGVEINPLDASDTLVVISSADGQGDGDSSNHILTTELGLLNLFTAGINDLDIDLNIVPALGESIPEVELNIVVDDQRCGETDVMLNTSLTFSNSASWTFTFSDGTVLNYAANPGTIIRTYDDVGPDSVTIETINSCGRSNSQTFPISYAFEENPDAEFSKVQSGNICIGSVVNFNANTSGYDNYNWDFGDGTEFSLGPNNVSSHVYSALGTYNVTLEVTKNTPISCFSSLTKTDFVVVVDCTVIPPTAVINTSSVNGCIPSEINFTDGTIAGDPATSWLWNFGDGTFATSQNPSDHTYTSASTYFVSLEACNSGGCDEDIMTIIIDVPTINTWIGPVSDNWMSNPAYWSTGMLPKICDQVVIPLGKTVTLQNGETSSIRSISIENGGILNIKPTAILSVKE